MKTIRPIFNTVATLAFVYAVCLPGLAAPIVANGGFEAGFAGWTRVDSLGSDGTFFLQSGTASPINGDVVPAPPGGLNAAMSDGGAPGSHVLYQDFTISGGGPQFLLSFDLFIGNRGGMFGTPNPASLDFGINEANQQVRVDLMTDSADPFSVAPGDVLMNLFQSQPGDSLESGYATYAFNITALVNANPGATLRLRFAETDNLAQLQAGVDNVSVASVPEPSTVLMTAIGGLLLVVSRLRRQA